MNKLDIKYLLILFLLFIPLKVNALVNVDSYCVDAANILSPETEAYIENQSKILDNKDGTQIVVVTVKNLEGRTIEDYANDLFNTTGIGAKNKNNGLLLLLALDERKFRVEVGDGLGGILPDGKTGRFQDLYIIPYLKQNKWDEGVRNGYDAFFKEIASTKNIDVEYTEPKKVGTSTASNGDSISKNEFGLLVLCFVILMINSLICLNAKRKQMGLKLISTFISSSSMGFIMLFTSKELNMPILIMLGMNVAIGLLSLTNDDKRHYGGGGSSSWSSSSSSSWSSGGGSSFSGGGGHSSGGGSSRGF